MVTALLHRTKGLGPLKRGALFYLNFFGVVGMFLPFLHLYFRQELGFSGRQLAILAMISPLMKLFVAIPVASLADRRNWRIPLLMATLVGASIMMACARFPQTFLLWVPVWFATAIFLSPVVPLADSLIARMSVRHDLNYGTMRLWGSISFALSSVGCGMLWERIGFRTMFLTVGLCLLPALLFASRLEEIPGSGAHREKPSFQEIAQDHGLMIILAAAVLVGAAINLSIMFDGIYMKSLGGAESFVGMMFSLGAWAELPMMQYRDRLARRLGGPAILFLAYLLLALAYIGYVFVWSPRILLGMAFVRGMGFGLFLVSTVKLLNERVPESWSSTVQSLFSASGFGVAPLLVAPLGGELFDRFGLKAVFITSSVCVTAAAALLLVAMLTGILTNVVRDKQNVFPNG